MFRYIPFKRYDPYVKTALNDVLRDYSKTSGNGVVWFSGWSQDCINIGVSQDPQKVLDLKEVEKLNLLITRRQSGGGATFLSKEGEITWAIIATESFFPEDINDVYKEVSRYIIAALSTLGIESSHKPINDVITDNGKISGATLRKEDGVVYVGGTLIYEINNEILFKVLRPENDDLKKEKIFEKDKKITSISKESNFTFENTLEKLKDSFLKNQEFFEEKISNEEMEIAQKLAEKYKDKEWIYNGFKKN